MVLVASGCFVGSAGVCHGPTFGPAIQRSLNVAYTGQVLDFWAEGWATAHWPAEYANQPLATDNTLMKASFFLFFVLFVFCFFGAKNIGTSSRAVEALSILQDGIVLSGFVLEHDGEIFLLRGAIRILGTLSTKCTAGYASGPITYQADTNNHNGRSSRLDS